MVGDIALQKGTYAVKVLADRCVLIVEYLVSRRQIMRLVYKEEAAASLVHQPGQFEEDKSVM